MKPLAYTALGFALATALFLVGPLNAQREAVAQTPTRYGMICRPGNVLVAEMNRAASLGWRVVGVDQTGCPLRGGGFTAGFVVILER